MNGMDCILFLVELYCYKRFLDFLNPSGTCALSQRIMQRAVCQYTGTEYLQNHTMSKK